MNVMDADRMISHLGLEGHVEGGYFKEVYRSPMLLASGDRSLSTVIYFLLKSGQFSAFHRLKSDEVWFFHCGCPLRIHQIDESGVYSSEVMGGDLLSGQVFQYLFRAGVYFAAEPVENDSFSLVSCMVSPGFDYRDFELASLRGLTEKFPQHEEIISTFANC